MSPTLINTLRIDTKLAKGTFLADDDRLQETDFDERVHVTLYIGKTSTKPKSQGAKSWSALVPQFTNHRIRPEKDGIAFAPHKLLPEGSRRNDQVECITMAVLDCDNGLPFEHRRDQLQGLCYAAYSSFSHTSEHPKYRLVLPLLTPVASADWPACFAGLSEQFPGIDPACKDAARLFYLPSCPQEREQDKWAVCEDGAALDPQPLIARGRELLWKNERPVSSSVSRINAEVLDNIYPDRPLTDEDIERAKSALDKIPSDLSRNEWLKVVWAFSAATGNVRHEYLREWCAQSADKYPDFDTALDSAIRTDRQPDGGIGAGTLFQIAKHHGWVDSCHSAVGVRTAVMETLNDAGNADRIVKAASGQLRYCKDLSGWLVWTDGHWHWDTTGGVIQFATTVMRAIFDEAKAEQRNDDAKRLAQHASNSLSHTRITAAIELAKSCVGIPVRAIELDADPYVIGVKNGVIDLRTGLFRVAQPVDLITRCMRVEYAAEATSQTWEVTLNSVFCESQNIVDFFHRAAGYSLTGITSEQCFFFLYGSGANGKSTVLNVMRDVLGGYGMQTSSDVLMTKSNANPSGPTPEIARLAGPRFVAANETEEGQRLAESMVKQLTGGDAITARVLHGDTFDFVPVFKLWLAGNHRPVIRGDDHGIWRRMVMIGFDKKYSGAEQNKHLPELLRKEYSGILNWLIAGCLAWQKRGLDRPPEIVRQVDAYRSDMDLMQHWLDEACLIEQGQQIRAADIYTSYKNWSIHNGHRCISNQKFAQKLKDRGFNKAHDRNGTYYTGIALRQRCF